MIFSTDKRLLGLVFLAACGGVPNHDETMAARPLGLVFSFDLEPGPYNTDGSWRVEGTNQTGPVAAWEIRNKTLVLADPREGARPTFNLCWTPAITYRDVEVAVKVRAGSGVIDRGGGPMWRVQDKDNYYVARWNPLENNFRVYYVKDGKRVQLASADVAVDADAWHLIRIVHVGTKIECWLDETKLLEVDDATMPGPGGVGVWTKADAATTFDDLFVRPT